MPAYSTPGVYYEPVDDGATRVAPLRTDVTGFVGVAGRGPVGVPVRIASWRQFETVFGGLHPDGSLPHAVRAFFLNGGRLAYVVRAAAPGAEAAALPGAVQPAGGGTSLVEPSGFVTGAVVTVIGESPDQAAVVQVVDVDRNGRTLGLAVPLPAWVWDDRPLVVHSPTGWVTRRDDAVAATAGRLAVQSVAGFEAGQWVTLRQSGRVRRASLRLARVDQGGSVLSWEGAVPDAVRTAGPLRFETGATPAWASLDDAWGEPALEARATSPGTWGTTLRVVVSAGLGAATTAPPDQPLDRLSTRVADVSSFQRGDLVRVLQSGPAPAVAYAVVAHVDADAGCLRWSHPDPRRRLRWDGPLPATIDTRRAASVERVDAGVSVYVGNRLWEVHPGLSLVPEHPRYGPRILPPGGPGLVALVAVEDQPPAEPGRLALASGSHWLEGGGDGLAALTARDMAGSLGQDGSVGVAALAAVDDVAIVALPDAFLRAGPERVLVPMPPVEPDPCLPQCPPDPVAPMPPPRPVERAPSFTRDDSFTVQQAAVDQCEWLRDRVVLLDSPRAEHDARAEGVAAVRAWRKRFDTAFAGLYHPWLLVRDDLAGGLREVPPCGHVAGLAAATDLTDGVQRAPAGRELANVEALTVDLDEATHGLLNNEGINAVRRAARTGVRVLGARTLSSDPAWRWLNVRRLISFLAESIEHGLQWSVHEPNDDRLRDVVRIAISSLLLGVWERGGLRGGTAAEAFFVVSDDSNNPPAVTSAGQLVVDAGVAVAAPGEFIVLRVGRVAGELTVAETVPSGTAA